MKFFPILLTLIFLVSCAKEVPKTKAKFSLGAASSSYPGETFVYGKKLDSGEMFSYKLQNTDIEVELPHGKWKIMAIGWTGSDPFTGTVKCAQNDYELQDNEVTVDLSLSSGNCNDGVFGPQDHKAGNGEFFPVRFHACAGIESMFKNTPEEFSDTKNFGLCIDHPGLSKSFKVQLFSFDMTKDPNQNKKDIISSACVGNIASTSSPYQDSGIKLPAFDPSFFKFPIVVQAFPGANCEGSPTVKELPVGVLVHHPTYQIFGTTEGAKQNLYIDAGICNNVTNAATPFANGAYNAIGINYICNPTQLFAIDDDVARASGQFNLAADLDLTGINDQIKFTSSPYKFSGNLRGNGFKIKNYSKSFGSASVGGLFEKLGRATIRNVVLQDFNITDSGAALSIGTLAGEFSPGSGSNFIEIDVTVRHANINADTSPAVGGVFGYVSSTVGNRVFVKARVEGKYDENGVLIPGTQSTITGLSQVGGMVGSSYMGTNDQIIINKSVVRDTIVAGEHELGGIIGAAEKAEITNNSVNVAIQFNPTSGAQKSVGGIAGFVRRFQSSGNKVISTVDVYNPSSGNSEMGGIIGRARTSTINGDVAEININNTDTNNNMFDSIGGIAGFLEYYNNTESTGHNIQNVRAKITSVINGAHHGGIVGYMDGYASPSLIANSISDGNLHVKTNNSGNFKRGGIVGTNASNAAVRNSVSYANVIGYSSIGGIAGYNDGIIVENISRGYATAQGNAKVGGLVGWNSSNSSTEVKNSESHGVVTSPGVCSNNDCNYLIGTNDNNSGCASDFDGIFPINTSAGLSVNSTNISASNTNMIGNQCYNTSSAFYNGRPTCTGSTSIGSGTMNCTAGNYLSFYQNTLDSNKAHLAYYRDWVMAADLDNVTQRIKKVGGAAEPILIDSPLKWNTIAGSPFLMKKSFKLINDLDFSIPGFVPFGGNSANPEPFMGTFIPNKKRLRNISINVGATANNIGIFRRVGIVNTLEYPSIGGNDDPLVIENFNINLNSGTTNNVGAIGTMERGYAAIQVENGNYISQSGTSGSNVGGIVGNAFESTLKYCSFKGNINVSFGHTFVGGFVGSVDGSSGRLMLERSRLDVNNLIAYGDMGTLIGNIDRDIMVSNIYARVRNTFGTAPGQFDRFGVYGSTSSVNANSFFRDIFLDFYGTANFMVGGSSGSCSSDCYPIGALDNNLTVTNLKLIQPVNKVINSGQTGAGIVTIPFGNHNDFVDEMDSFISISQEQGREWFVDAGNVPRMHQVFELGEYH